MEAPEANIIDQNLSVAPMREHSFFIAVADPYDSVVRILSDAQRFGYGLLSLSLKVALKQQTCIVLTLIVPADANPDQIASRLNRHRAVISIRSA